MNILFSSASYVFTDHIPGGEYQVAHAVISELATRGHQIHIIVPKAKLKKHIPNVTVHEIGGYDFVQRESYFAYRWNWWTFSLRSYWMAKRIVKKYPIEIVHHLRPAFLEKFSLCWRLPVPFVYGPMSLPMTHSLPPETAMPGEPTKSNLMESLKNKLIDRLNFSLGKWLWNRMITAAASLPVSVPPTRQYLPAHCQNKTPLIPLGVDPNEFSPAPSPEEHPPTIFYAGHLVPAKGVNHLVQAMSDVLQVIPEARLVLAGDGFDRLHLEQMAMNLDIAKSIDFLGAVPFDTMPTQYRQCDIFCLPTLAEAFGLSLLQAMASGKPVVASAVGGIPHFVDDGLSGHLVPPSDSKALALALIHLLQNPKTMLKMGAYNREHVLKHHSWSAVVDQIEALYQRLSSHAA